LTLLVSVTISLVGKSDAESPGCSAAIGGVTSVIECPDPIPAIGFVELSHLLTTVFVKVCGWRPHDGGAAHAGGRRTQTSKGGNRGRFSEVARQTLWGFQRRRSVAEVC
jgi:hypothetical protein